jgi:hypothetical protein
MKAPRILLTICVLLGLTLDAVCSQITYTGNMSVQGLAGKFNTANGDTVRLVGNWDGWAKTNLMKVVSNSPCEYSLSLTQSPGTRVQYRFCIITGGHTNDFVPVWETPLLSKGGNRSFVVPAIDTNLPAVLFSDQHSPVVDGMDKKDLATLLIGIMGLVTSIATIWIMIKTGREATKSAQTAFQHERRTTKSAIEQSLTEHAFQINRAFVELGVQAPYGHLSGFGKDDPDYTKKAVMLLLQINLSYEVFAHKDVLGEERWKSTENWAHNVLGPWIRADSQLCRTLDIAIENEGYSPGFIAFLKDLKQANQPQPEVIVKVSPPHQAVGTTTN